MSSADLAKPLKIPIYFHNLILMGFSQVILSFNIWSPYLWQEDCYAKPTEKMWGKKLNWELNAGNNIFPVQPLIPCQVQDGLFLPECLSVPSGHLQIGNSTVTMARVSVWDETLQPRAVISWPFLEWGELANNLFRKLHVFRVLGNHLATNSVREVRPLLGFSREEFHTDVKQFLRRS